MSKSRRNVQIQKSAIQRVEEPAFAVVRAPAGNGQARVVEMPPQSELPVEPPAEVSASPTLRSVANRLTLEVVFYSVIGLAALLLRLANLDAQPLGPGEAQTAVAAWDFLNGKPVSEFVSPLLFTLNWLTFFLFGASDLSARFLPATLSALVVFVPALGRGALGKTGALLAALLIAFSPSLVFFARTLSAVDLAAGGALAALILFLRYRERKGKRALYLASFFAAASLTADGAAFPLLIAGGLYIGIITAMANRGAGEKDISDAPSTLEVLANPLVRAGGIFAATYVVIATTFLLNRDGLGVAFNLMGAWLGGFASFGEFAAPLNWLIVYEPLPLIFGLAGLVLAFTLSRTEGPAVGTVRMLAIVSLGAFLWYTAAGVKEPAVVVAVALPLMFLAGWFIGNFLDRAQQDIRETGGWRSMRAGEIPVLAMLMVLAALVYLQFATFLQQTRFSPALDPIYRMLSGNSGETSVMFAAITLGIITLLLLGVFVGLSILLIGAARTTSLMAFAILIVLSLGMVRALWLLNFSGAEPLRELIVTTQTPAEVRDLVRDLEWNSQWAHGDSHVIRVAADSGLGATGRWYLRNFPNLVWTEDIANAVSAEAVVTDASSPPPGNWRGQRYHVGLEWEPMSFAGLELWKWFLFRQGGGETWQSTMLWLPTTQE